MTRAEAISRIKRKLSFMSGTTLDAAILEALVDAQRKLENSSVFLPNGVRTPAPWFLQVVDEAFPVVAGTTTYDLPDGWIKELEDHPPHFLNTSGAVLNVIKVNPGIAKEQLVAVEGPSQVYYYVAKQIVLLPPPDDAYDLYLSYLRRDTALAADGDTNLFLTEVPDLLIGVAGAELAGDKRDASALAEFEKLIVAGGAMLWDQTLAREMTNKRSAIGVVR